MGNKHKNTINFFWSGSEWSILHDMCIKSHIHVGHEVVIWYHGEKPKNKLWSIDDVTFQEASQIIDIDPFIKQGGNLKTASSLWRFVFLYRYGGWYSDTDALAIEPWHDDEWVLCSGEGFRTLSTGIMKVPAGEPMFLDMVHNIRREWGNVGVFNKFYLAHKGDIKPTHDNSQYYPYTWDQWDTPLHTLPIPKVKSVHLYHTMFERNGILGSIERRIKLNKFSMLSRIYHKIK